jgi:hypothetical protein
MSWIEWCGCKRRILTTKQIEEKKQCDLCQQEKRQSPSIKRIEDMAEEFNS